MTTLSATTGPQPLPAAPQVAPAEVYPGFQGKAGTEPKPGYGAPVPVMGGGGDVGTLPGYPTPPGVEEGIAPFVRQFVPAAVLHPQLAPSGIKGWMPSAFVLPEAQPHGVLFNPDRWFAHKPGSQPRMPQAFDGWANCLLPPPPEPPCPPPAPATGPGKATAPDPVEPAAADRGTITIKRGDTLSELAPGHGVTWQQLWYHNRETVPNPHRIYPGQVLKVPPCDLEVPAGVKIPEFQRTPRSKGGKGSAPRSAPPAQPEEPKQPRKAPVGDTKTPPPGPPPTPVDQVAPSPKAPDAQVPVEPQPQPTPPPPVDPAPPATPVQQGDPTQG